MTRSDRGRYGAARLNHFVATAAYLVATYAALLALWWCYLAVFDGGEISTSTTQVVFGRCPAPYTMNGRECQLLLQTSLGLLLVHAVIFFVVAAMMAIFAHFRSFTGVLVVAIVGGFSIGWLPVGMPLLVFAIVMTIQSLRQIRLTELA